MDHDAIVQFITEEIETLGLICSAKPQRRLLLDELEDDDPLIDYTIH